MTEMHHPFLVGPRLYLRRVERSDLDTNYFQWLNDPDVTRHMYQGTFPNSEEAMVAYYEAMVRANDRVNFAMVTRSEGHHIGNIALTGIDWVNRTAELGIIIGEKSYWGQGYGSEAIGLLESYAFDRLNLRRLWAGTWSSNDGMARAFERRGWSREGCQREHAYRNDTPVDVLLFGLLRHEYYASAGSAPAAQTTDRET